MNMCASITLTLAILSATPLGSSSTAAQVHATPENVMITFHAKAGAEAELAQTIAKHWATARRLNLVVDAPHLTLRSTERERTDFVEIVTWRDAGVPDAAPPEIQKIWGEMNRLVEPRGGRPGLSIDQMSVVAEQP